MTKCVDEAICPACKHHFLPEATSCEERQYEYDCPNCGATLSIFESVEYQTSMAEEGTNGKD